MHRLHLTRNLRTLAFLLILTAAIAAPVGLWWLNRSGLPESWRATIEGEIAKQGVHISIGALSYNPFRGIIAAKVKVFENASRKKEIANLERVIIDLDKTKLARGAVVLAKIELKDAGLTLAVRPDDPNSELLEIRHASGTPLAGARGRKAVLGPGAGCRDRGPGRFAFPVFEGLGVCIVMVGSGNGSAGYVFGCLV